MGKGEIEGERERKRGESERYRGEGERGERKREIEKGFGDRHTEIKKMIDKPTHTHSLSLSLSLSLVIYFLRYIIRKLVYIEVVALWLHQ